MLKKNFLFLSIFLLPTALFFDIDNFYQVPIKNFFIFLLVQLFIFFVFIIIVNIFTKKIMQINWINNLKINKINITLILTLLYFLIFFFSDLVKYFNKVFNFDNTKLFFLDALLAVFVYLFTFYILLKIVNKKRFILFLVFFVSLNYLNVFIDYYKNFSFNNHAIKKTLLKKENIINKQSNTNIYYFIFDGMMDIEQAKKNQISTKKIFSKEKLKKNNFIYMYNSVSNYSTSYLSIHSLFDMDYIYNEKSKRYSYANREVMYPNSFINVKNYPKSVKLFNTLKTKFHWMGNEYASCIKTKYISCVKTNNANLIYLLTEFYSLTPLKYILKYYKIPSEYANLIENTEEYFKNISRIINSENKYKNNFFFFHVILPHSIQISGKRIFPYDKDCNYNSLKDYGYKESYICALKTINKISKEINKIDDKEKIIVFSADHGWNIEDAPNKENPIVINGKLNLLRKKDINDRAKIFNLISAPPRCELSEKKNKIKSPINNMKFIFNCAYDFDLSYEKNIHYKAFYMKDGDVFGKVFKYELDKTK